MAALPRHLKKTLTWDQGTEMARHLELTAATPASTSTSPNAPAPGSAAPTRTSTDCSASTSDLSIHSHTRVAHVMEELNTRPRKLLGYHTPKQALHAETRPSTVAFKSLDKRPKKLERCNDC
jgi:IS30 family transposase